MRPLSRASAPRGGGGTLSLKPDPERLRVSGIFWDTLILIGKILTSNLENHMKHKQQAKLLHKPVITNLT